MVNNHLVLHLCGVGLAVVEAERLSQQVTKWIRLSGSEWTVDRFKSLRLFLKARMLKEVTKIPEGFATRKNRDGKVIFRDPTIHRIMSLPLNPKNIKIMEGFCRTYTAVKASAMTRKQRTKFLTNVEGPSKVSNERIDEVGYNLLLRRLSVEQTDTVCTHGQRAKSLVAFLGNEKKAPVFQGSPASFTGTKERLDDVSAVAFMDYLMSDTATNEFWRKNQDFVGDRLVGIKTLPHREATHQLDLQAGKLSVIQEGGCKARWIANPAMLFQAFGEPLKRKLKCYTQIKYPESAVDNQDEGRQTAVEWLAAGRKVWAYDATAFTDRLPLRLQDIILRRLMVRGVITQQDYDAFTLVMHKSWISKDIGRDIKWSVGQPLGYGPSFPLANLTHAILLDTLDTERTRMWRVVGDDVIISDEKLADQYLKTIEGLGVEINQSKSFISDEYGEFLGKLVTPNGLIPSGKASKVDHPAQIVNRFEWYGHQLLKAIKATAKNRNFRKWSTMLFYPKDLGGAGLRIPNSSAAENIQLLNTDGIQRQRLTNEINTFTGVNDYNAAVDLGKQIELRNLFLADNVSYVFATDLGANSVNECHGIQTELLCSNDIHRESEKAFRQQTFTSIVDNAIMAQLRKDKRTIPHDLIKGNGFIHKAEKPFNYESPKCFIKEKSHDYEQNESKVTKSVPRVFSQRCKTIGSENKSGYQKAQSWSFWTSQTQVGSNNPTETKRSPHGKIRSV